MTPRHDDRFRLNRRAFLGRQAGALGTLALAQLLDQETRRGAAWAADARPRAVPPRAGRARSVICLFQHGGPSQMDLFDPKPSLTRNHGKPHPQKLEVHFHTQQGKLLASLNFNPIETYTVIAVVFFLCLLPMVQATYALERRLGRSDA